MLMWRCSALTCIKTDGRTNRRTNERPADNSIIMFDCSEDMMAPNPYSKDPDVQQIGLRKMYMTHFDEGGIHNFRQSHVAN